MPEVAQAINEAEKIGFGNSSSPHWAGRAARSLLEQSREQLALQLGVEAKKLFFTSGGTESNNSLLHQLSSQKGKKHILISSLEHPSIRETCNILAQQDDFEFSEIPANSLGQSIAPAIETLLRPESKLISIMTANNETGTIQNIADFANIASENGILFHTDASQALGKITINWNSEKIDYGTATAHKLGGPKGIGLLYIRNENHFQPLLTGGKQERVRRAGTESVALAVGFAKAIEILAIQEKERIAGYKKIQEQIINELKKIEVSFLNTDLENCLPNTLNIGFTGISAESLLISLDLDGIAVSTGSACSSGALEASHVLLAMGLSREEAKSSLRISWGWSTTPQDIDIFLKQLSLHISRIKNKK